MQFCANQSVSDLARIILRKTWRHRDHGTRVILAYSIGHCGV